MTGRQTLKEKENEKLRGKKKYIERQIEDLEAEQEIKDFIEELYPDNNKEPSID